MNNEYQIGFSDEFTYGDTLIKYEVSEFKVNLLKNCIEKTLRLKLLDTYDDIINDLLNIFKNNINNAKDLEYQILLWSITEKYAYFENVVLLPFCYWLYKNNYTRNLLSSNTWNTKGIKYGKDFERFVFNSLDNVGLNISKFDKLDALIKYQGIDVILEIKNNYTDTTHQLDRYIKRFNISDAITINGNHKNNISLDICVDLWKITESFLNILKQGIKANDCNYINLKMEYIYKRYINEGVVGNA